MISSDIDRLRKMADTDSAYRMLTLARRAEDYQSALDACLTLISSGSWKEPLEYCEELVGKYIPSLKIRILTKAGWGPNPADDRIVDPPTTSLVEWEKWVVSQCPKFSSLSEEASTTGEPQDCHRLCNVIREVFSLAVKDDEFPLERVLQLWIRSVQCWWPAGWQIWLERCKGWRPSYSVFRDQTIKYHTPGAMDAVVGGLGKVVFIKEEAASPGLPVVPSCVCNNGKCLRCGVPWWANLIGR